MLYQPLEHTIALAYDQKTLSFLIFAGQHIILRVDEKNNVTTSVFATVLPLQQLSVFS